MPPPLSDDFAWAAAPWGWALRCRPLNLVAHGWTTRQLQLRGTPEAESAGWAAIADAVGLTSDGIVRLSQVHGAAVHVASAPGSGTPRADIVVTQESRQVVTVQVADCAPILTADRSGRVVAASHAGWRGTAANVSGVTVRALSDTFQVDPSGLSTAIGPCIGPCCYEVGEELVSAFQSNGWTEADCGRWFVRRSGKLFLDIWRANADQLERAGVGPGRIFVSGLCTACHPDWFCSYRREGAGTGRLAGFIRPGRV